MSAAERKADFIASMIRQGVLRFGEFQLKSGLRSPYFFNLGNVSGGAELAELGCFYADAIEASGLDFDVLFGPAYKGIPIAVATAIALAQRGHSVGVAFDRKEPKAHGEGGKLIGAPLRGRVLMLDDVVSDGATKAEAAAVIEAAGAKLAGLVVALDRQEIVANGQTALERLEERLGAPVLSIAALTDVIACFRAQEADAVSENLAALLRHQGLHCP
ncbi:MAG: orotate phosphoribosyltransferase [Gammaproteobacteria bacterium]|nr:orotate phosphoribosyltransferase [Gammaproteobacteria bacterium]